MKRLLKTAAVLIAMIAPAFAGPVTPVAGNFIPNIGLSTATPTINITSATIKTQLSLPYITAGLCTTTDATGKVIGTPCGSGGGGGGSVINSNVYNVPFYSVAGSSNALSGSTNLQIFTSSTVANGPFVSISTGGGANLAALNYLNGTNSIGTYVINSSPTQTTYAFYGIASGPSTSTYGIFASAQGNNTNTAASLSASGGTTNNAISVTAGNENFQNLNAAQFIQTDASKNLKSYDLLGGANTFAGQQSFTNVLPSTFSALAITNSLTLTGNGNFSFLNSDGKTYQVIGSSLTNPGIGDVVIFLSSNTIGDGGTSGSSLLSTNNTWIGTNTYNQEVLISSQLVTSVNPGNVIFSNNGLSSNATAQVTVYEALGTTNDKLFSVGSNGQVDQVYFPNLKPAYFGREGALVGALTIGAVGQINELQSGTDGLNFINLYDGTGSMEFSTRGNGQDIYFTQSNGGEQGRFSNQHGFTVSSSETIKGAGGIGALVGTFTNSLTVQGQNVCEANGTNCPASGGGGSQLQVTQSGVQVTSPTASLNFYAGDFNLSAVGSTATIYLDPSSTDYIQNTSALQSGSVFYISSGTINGPLTINTPAGTSEAFKLFNDGANTHIDAGANFDFTYNNNSAQNAKWYTGSGSNTNGLANPQLDMFSNLVFPSTQTIYYRQQNAGNNYISFIASQTVTTTQYVLPSADGTSGQLMGTDGSHNLSFKTAILSQASLQSGATFYVSSGTVVSLTAGTANINGVINILNNDSSASAMIDGVGTAGQQQIQITASNGVGINTTPSPGQDLILPNLTATDATFNAASFPKISSTTAGATAGRGVIWNDSTNDALEASNDGGTAGIIAITTNTSPTAGHLALWGPFTRLIDGGVPATGGGGGASTTTVQLNGTTLSASATNFNFINGTGFNFTMSTPTASNVFITGSADQSVMQSIAADQAGADVSLFPTGGSGTTYTACPSASLSVYTQSQRFILVPDVASGASPTLNICALGPIALKKNTGANDVAIVAGDLAAGVPYLIIAASSPVAAFQVQPVFFSTASTSGGSGVSLSSTNTWTATQNFSSTLSISSYTTITTTGPTAGLYVTGTGGEYGTNNPGAGAFEVDCSNTGTDGNCAQFYSNQGTQSSLDAVVTIYQANANYNERPLYMVALGQANSPLNMPRIDGYQYSGYTMEDTTRNGDSINGIYQMSDHNNALRLERRISGSFENGLLVAASTATGVVAINSDYGIPVSTLEVAGNGAFGAANEGIAAPLNGLLVQGNSIFQSSFTAGSPTSNINLTTSTYVEGQLQISSVPFIISGTPLPDIQIRGTTGTGTTPLLGFYGPTNSQLGTIGETSGGNLVINDAQTTTDVILQSNFNIGLDITKTGQAIFPKGLVVSASSSTFITPALFKSSMTVLALNTNNYDATFSTTTSAYPSGVAYQLAITTNGFISVSASTQPTLSGCGTSPTIVGSDTAFTITPGGTAGGCTATFNPPFKNTPICIYSLQTASLTNAPTVTESATAWTITDTSLTSKIDVHCFGNGE